MQCQLTAVYELQKDGWVVASIAEIPGVHTQGETMEEARENLADALALIMQTNRELALAGGSPGSRTEAFSFTIPLPDPEPVA